RISMTAIQGAVGIASRAPNGSRRHANLVANTRRPIAACTTSEVFMSESLPWGDYALLQRQADRRRLDAIAWAAEEQAEEFLDRLAANNLPTDPSCRKAWLDNLATNRAKKHRRRVAILPPCPFPPGIRTA